MFALPVGLDSEVPDLGRKVEKGKAPSGAPPYHPVGIDIEAE
jgi:hypothetical protein